MNAQADLNLRWAHMSEVTYSDVVAPIVVAVEKDLAFIQRRINVDATSLRCIDVDAMLYKRHVSAGIYHQTDTVNSASEL